MTPLKVNLMVIVHLMVVLSAYHIDGHLPVAKKVVKRNIPRRCEDPDMRVTASIQAVSPNKINISIIYNELNFPNHTFLLTLFKGDEIIDCTEYNVLKRSKFQIRQIPPASTWYENVDPGYYCALLHYSLPDAKVNDDSCPFYLTETVHVKDKLYSSKWPLIADKFMTNFTFDVTEAVHVSLEEPKNQTFPGEKIEKPDDPKWMYAVSGICVAVLVIFAIIVLKFDRLKRS